MPLARRPRPVGRRRRLLRRALDARVHRRAATSSASRCTRCASPSATRRAPTTPQIRRAMDARELIFDTLAAQQTSGRHDAPAEERRRAYFPFKPFCETCGRDDTQVTGYDGRRSRRYRCRHGHEGTMSARRRRADQRQARVEGRLADALGPRGRRLRARRRGPPRADGQLHRRARARARRLRRRAAALGRLLVRLARRPRRQDVGLVGRRADPRDGAARARAGDRALAVHPPAAVAGRSRSTCRRRACRSSTTSGTASPRARSRHRRDARRRGDVPARGALLGGRRRGDRAARVVSAARRSGRPHAGQPRADRADRRPAPRRAGRVGRRPARRARAAPVVRDRLRRAAARRAAHDAARALRRRDLGEPRRRHPRGRRDARRASSATRGRSTA